MYYVSKRMEIAGSHKLNLSYDSPCQNIHGHNWIVTVFCEAEELNKDGMIIDFKHIKNAIHDKLDHKHLNDVLDFNTTAENMSAWITKEMNLILPVGSVCYKVIVQESEGNVASYILEGYDSNGGVL